MGRYAYRRATPSCNVSPRGFGGAVVRASAFHLWDMSSILAEDFTHHTHVKRVSQRSAESRGFSPGTPVSSHRESWQGGLGYIG